MESVEYSTSFPPTLLPCRRNQQCFQRFSSREVTLGQVRKIGIQFIIYLLIDTVIPCKKQTHSHWYRDTSFSSHWYRDTSFSLIPCKKKHWANAKPTRPVQDSTTYYVVCADKNDKAFLSKMWKKFIEVSKSQFLSGAILLWLWPTFVTLACWVSLQCST